LPEGPQVHPVVLSRTDTQRFGAGYVALKGEIGGRLLHWLAGDPTATEVVAGDGADVLALLAEHPLPEARPTARRAAPTADLAVDYVVDIPAAWREESEARPIKFFLPDWDDMVDPAYNFEAERHSGGSASWWNEVYAHQLYGAPNYDGILV